MGAIPHVSIPYPLQILLLNVFFATKHSAPGQRIERADNINISSPKTLIHRICNYGSQLPQKPSPQWNTSTIIRPWIARQPPSHCGKQTASAASIAITQTDIRYRKFQPVDGTASLPLYMETHGEIWGKINIRTRRISPVFFCIKIHAPRKHIQCT